MFGRKRGAARAAVAPRDTPDPDAPAIVAEHLSRAFADNVAVDDLSFTVAPGELYGLVGPDGAGKTTTIRMVTGLVAPDGGEARVRGLSAESTAAAVRESIGYMPQQYSLYGDLSVTENLTFFGRLFGLPKAEARERMDQLLDITRLSRFGDRRADALSGGMYKKLALACALLHRPPVLVLDEPSNGVDPVSRRELWDLLHRFVDGGMAVLLATPYMDEAARCDRVGLLHRGELLAEGPPERLIRDFHHATLMLHCEDRAAVEAAVEDRPDVLALSPHGADLRVVVPRPAVAAFTDLGRRGGASFTVSEVSPDFEDVYLGLLADAEAA
ncbi:MAG: ABC transporter ATP-binding protein [Deltaproteobacteria bacterium HGW-Deltaproteobacteria-14]|jgi:ABC-2 type transport system ATP-binding protein|nr:MAG: ABC transporter ATP-binding protein [Deltaproteobacteria bacterium HGW-Deltaproteobacteria-14]